MRIDEIVVGPRFRQDFSGIEALAASIANPKVGLLQPPGVTPDGRLLWGECRLRAAKLLGWTEIPVIVREVDPADRLAIEAAENFARKDFTLSEAVAIKRALEPELREEAAARQNAGTLVQTLHKGKTREKVASATGYSHETLRKAEAIVSAAEAEPDRFGKLVADMNRTRRVAGVYRRLSIIQQGERMRAAPPPLPTGPFNVGVADPPWPFEIRMLDPSRRAVCPYPTMSVADICALPFRKLMADDSIFWLWTTNMHLLDGSARRVLDAWGFAPQTMLTWVKDRFGTGDWLRGQTEHAILATRGHPVRTLTNQSTRLDAPMRAHSEKPDEFYARVESLCPAPPGGYVELFARKERPGWKTWGDEVEVQQEAAAE